MQGLLAGKSALVTGGGSGIGRATALALAREGARVAVADLSPETAAATVARINDAGGQAISIGLDVTHTDEVAAMIATTVAAFGSLDVAFNNAGISGVHVDAVGLKMADWSEKSFDRMIEVNLKSVWLCMKQEILHMLQAGHGGSIVNTASILGLVGTQFSSAYVAAKHGVVGLTKAAALEYAESGIRVNAVCPGYIETPMTEDVMKRRGGRIMAMVAAARMGTPEENRRDGGVALFRPRIVRHRRRLQRRWRLRRGVEHDRFRLADTRPTPRPHRGRGRGPSRQRREGEGQAVARCITRFPHPHRGPLPRCGRGGAPPGAGAVRCWFEIQAFVIPPSTVIVWPFTYDASSEHRKRITLATSDGWP